MTKINSNKSIAITDFLFSQKGLKKFDNYEININGEVFNIKTKRKYKGSINTQGYKVIGLKDIEGKYHTIYIHHLMAYIFLIKPKSNEELQIDHINQNRLDNKINNLKYTTKMENLKNRKPRGKNIKKIDTVDLLNKMDNTNSLLQNMLNSLKIQKTKI